MPQLVKRDIRSLAHVPESAIVPHGQLVAKGLNTPVDRVYASVGEIVNDPTDVYALDEFPHGDMPFRPKQVFNLLEDYAVSADPLRIVCDRHEMSPRSFYHVKRRYTQIQEHYAQAQRIKCDVIVDKTFEIAENKSGDVLQDPATGKLVINNANVRRDEMRIKTGQFFAERLNAKYMDKRGIAVKAEVVSTNITLPAPKDLQSLDINDLGSVFGK